MKLVSIAALALALSAVSSGPAQAQDAPQDVQGAASTPRTRIGLALGGGSARGLAHIGVLQWFEEHRIPVDSVVGTSMGGLMAGAYASGMSPADIRALMKEVDWDLMFVADSPFKYKTFRRKQDKRAFPSQLEFGLKHGFTLPGGLNPGQQVALLLDRIALPYYDVPSFDDLPTPFRCVATDLNKGDAVVLGKGSLSQALRATMAIPGVFTPVNYENWLLVDGGVLNNIPADVAKQMGAQVVIAVNVGADVEVDPNAAQSMFSLLGRTIDTMMTVGVRGALKSADIIIDPDLKGLDSMSWRKTDELAERGYQAAERMKDKLLPYAVSEAEYQAFLNARQARRKTQVPVPTSITVRGATSAREEAFIRQSLIDNVGVPVDWERISRQILKITGTDRYEYLSYRLTDTASGPTLLVGVFPKTYGPPFLALQPDLSNIDSSSFAVNLAGLVTAYDWVGSGSEVRIGGIIGTEQSAGIEVYRPFGKSQFFVSPRGYFDRLPRNYYVDEQFVGEYRVKRFGGGLDLGFNSGQRAEVRLGVDAADVRGRLRIGNPDLPELQGTEKFATLQFTYDSQTSPMVPTRGLHNRAWLRYYFGAPEPVTAAGAPTISSVQEFWQGEVSGTYFHRVGKSNDRWFLRYGAGSSFGDDPLVNDFFLGGPFKLGAFNNGELTGPNYLLGTAGYLRQVGRLPDVLGGGMFLGGWFEQGSTFTKWDDAVYRSSVSFGAVLESLLGPVFGGASFDFDGRFRLYIAVGPLFRW